MNRSRPPTASDLSYSAERDLEKVEAPADPTAFYELSLAEQWGDGAPVLPTHVMFGAQIMPIFSARVACQRDRGEETSVFSFMLPNLPDE